MKKNLFAALSLAVGMALIASCGSAPKTEGTVSSQIEVDDSDEVRIDWRGRSAGVKEPPAWVLLAATGDPDNEISKLPRLEGKKAVLMFFKGTRLEIVETWLNTQAYAQAGQRIRTGVGSNAGDGLEGNLEGADTMLSQFASLFSQATLTGFGKEMDYWIKTRSKKGGTEEYTMYAVYAISKEDLKASIDETFNRVETKTAREQDIKTKLSTQMDRLLDSINF